MKALAKAGLFALLCLVAGPSFGADCSDLGNVISINKNNPKALRKLLTQCPQCGEIFMALGDYFYDRQVWNEAYVHYQEATKYLPGEPRLAKRIQEISPKMTAMIKDEEALLVYRRGLAGKTSSSGGSVPEGSFQLAMAAAPKSETVGTAASKQTGSERKAETRSEPAVQGDSKAVVGRELPSSTKVYAKAEVQSKRASSQSSSSSKSQPSQTSGVSEKLGLMINFDYASSKITPESEKLLSGYAEILNSELAGRKFMVMGHSDSIGSREFNLQLSLERAKAVGSYLARSGVDSSRLEVRGYGFDRPIYDNETEEGRSKNRRVEFELK